MHGTVRWRGPEIPEPTLIENTTDPEVCGRLQRTEELVVDTESRGIAHAIVALRGIPAEQVEASPPARLVIDNRNCRFEPHVAVLTVGSTIEAVSHDEVLHTVHLYGALERNLALPDPTASMTVTVDEPGMITVLCDVHGWMRAYVRVDAHPFHAVTDARGAFVIEEVPPGSYELEVWHERLGTRTLPVRIEPGGRATLDIAYDLEAR